MKIPNVFFVICLLLIKTVCNAEPISDIPKKEFIYGTYNYYTRNSVVVSNATEQILDFSEENSTEQIYPSRVHVSTNNTIPLEYPIFITATQQKGISSWELPLVVQDGGGSILFNDMSRTLCPHDSGPDIKTENRPTVHITTQNPANTTVDITLTRVTDFYVEVNKNISLHATPSTPKYYYFSFEQNPWNISRELRGLPSFNYTIPKSVILIIDSDDELCATVSIQNNSCPVFDDQKEIMYQGYRLTMTSKGGITLTQSMFPRGFYVVFAVRETDSECTGMAAVTPADSRRLKNFQFRIIETVSYREYVIGAAVIIVLVLLIIAFVALAAETAPRNTYTEEVLIVSEPGPSTSRVDATSEEDTAPMIDHEQNTAEELAALTVERLSRAPPDTLARRSQRYTWGALTIAVVYSLPVVQLLFTYQRMVFQTGNQDLCYYNFLCAHPLGFLSDFNHVYSNVAYLVFGASFMLQVRARRRRETSPRQELGIPPHYGLLYAMGLALCMEGFLSACYHLCPNKMNFQFDSSFMYVIAVLVMLKLYQNRHSDLVPGAHATFLLIALVIAVGMMGILFPSVFFSVLFTTLHLTTCLILTLHVYYAGQFNMDRGVFGRAWQGLRARGWRALAPARMYRARAGALAVANLLNWTIAVYAAWSHNKDVARQLLVILMGNSILYLWFYIGMKLVHGERPSVRAWLLAALAHAAWAVAAYHFIHGNTRWSETPASSRRRNAACSVLGVFDSHDIWHVSSAAACYLSYNLLLVLDDDVKYTRTKLLPAF